MAVAVLGIHVELFPAGLTTDLTGHLAHVLGPHFPFPRDLFQLSSGPPFFLVDLDLNLDHIDDRVGVAGENSTGDSFGPLDLLLGPAKGGTSHHTVIVTCFFEYAPKFLDLTLLEGGPVFAG